MRSVAVGLLVALGACGRIDFDPIGTGSVSGERGKLAVGYGHVCELRGTDVWCWGEGNGGQTGNDTQPKFVPTHVLGLPPVTQIAAGAAHTCPVFASGMYCWGDNDYGQLGIGEQAIAVRPVVVPFP